MQSLICNCFLRCYGQQCDDPSAIPSIHEGPPVEFEWLRPECGSILGVHYFYYGWMSDGAGTTRYAC